MNTRLLMNFHRISKLSSHIIPASIQFSSFKLYSVPRRSFSILDELCWRKKLSKTNHTNLKKELIDQNQELVQVVQTINETNNFKDLIVLVNQYSESVASRKKDTQIDQILPFYIALFIQKSIELETQQNLNDQNNQFDTQKSSFQQCQAILSELLVNNLSSCSVEWLLLILEQSVLPNNEIDQKMLKVYEYLVARTPFLLRMTEIQISRFLQAITLVQSTQNKKQSFNVYQSSLEQQKQQQYWYIEMLEKIEFVIVERQLKGFSLKDLASLAFIYTTNNQGCESLFKLIHSQFLQQMTEIQVNHGEQLKQQQDSQIIGEDVSEIQQQLIMIYWSLSQQSFIGRIIEEKQIQLLLKNQQQFPPNYQIMLLSAYNSQRQYFRGVFSQILQSILPIKQ